MSDTPQGGWWKASDGKWYPPETHPDQAGHVGTDAFGAAIGATPAAGWWQANDGNWYPPDSVPGPTGDLGDELGQELPSRLVGVDRAASEPEIDLTERPDITADEAYDVTVPASAPGVSASSFWGESAVTTAPPLTSSESPPGPFAFEGQSLGDEADAADDVPPEISVLDDTGPTAGDLAAGDLAASGDLGGLGADPIESRVVDPAVPASPFEMPIDPFEQQAPVVQPEPASPFGAPPATPSGDPSELGGPFDGPWVSPVSPFAVPGDVDGTTPSSLFAAPPPVEDATVAYGVPPFDPAVDPAVETVQPAMDPGALVPIPTGDPVAGMDAPTGLDAPAGLDAPVDTGTGELAEPDARRGLFDLDDLPGMLANDQTAKRPLFGGVPSAPATEQPPAIEFDATGSSASHPGTTSVRSAKAVKARGSRNLLPVLLGVLGAAVVIGGLAFLLLGGGGDDGSESATVPSSVAPGSGATDDAAGQPSGQDPGAVSPTTVPVPAEIPAQVSGSGSATADLGHDVSDMLLALVTHDGPGQASFDLLDADGNTVQQLVGPGISGQYLGVIPVNFARGQSFRAVRFNGDGPWAVTFAVTTSAPSISPTAGSTYSDSGDRVVMVNGSAPFDLRTNCMSCAAPIQIRAWPTGATTAPQPIVADRGGVVSVPGGTAWLQVTAPGAESAIPAWTLTIN